MTLEDLALIFTRGIGSRGARHLVDYFGSAEALFAASRSEIVEGAGLRAELVDALLDSRNLELARREAEYCRRNNILAIAATDAEYPEALRDTADRPHVLFVKGNIEALGGNLLAMVGTRESSPAGQHACNTIVKGLAKSVDELRIVSGLAYGIDAAAHRAALNCNVQTVAVVATTLPDVSPAAHRNLAEDILRRGGALVSELHSQTHHNGSMFIARNRIIAGLCHGTLVVESPARGGSLATADIADSYGRVVMALPGRISDPASFGTNSLIRSGKARLVLSATDIIEDLGWNISLGVVTDAEVEDKTAGLSAAERNLYAAFDTAATLDWPSLMEATGLTMGELAMVVMDLEMKGLIRTLPGKRYERV